MSVRHVGELVFRLIILGQVPIYVGGFGGYPGPERLGLRLVVGFECASQSTCHLRMLGQKVDPFALRGEIEQPLLTRWLRGACGGGRRADHKLPSLIPYRLGGAATKEQVLMW